MGQNGFLPQDLFLLRKMWDDSSVLVEDSYGQEWVRYCLSTNLFGEGDFCELLETSEKVYCGSILVGHNIYSFYGLAFNCKNYAPNIYIHMLPTKLQLHSWRSVTLYCCFKIRVNGKGLETQYYTVEHLRFG